MSLGLGEITTQAHGLISVGDLPAARNLLAGALADTDPRPTHATAEHADAAGLLARVMVALGEPSGARAWAAYAYSATRRMHGVTDERTIGAAATLAAVLHRVGSHARAAHLYREVIDELCAIDGPESLRVLAAHADLATVEFARGQCDIARDRLEDAWELHREVYGEGHPAGIKMLARLGAMQRDCGRLSESDASLSVAIGLCRTQLPTDHPLVGQVVALAESLADPAHRCGDEGTGDPDPAGRPDGVPGPNGGGRPTAHSPGYGDHGHPAGGHSASQTAAPIPREPAEQSFDFPYPGPVTGAAVSHDPHLNGGPNGANAGPGTADSAPAGGDDPPAGGGWPTGRADAPTEPPWAEPEWIDPDPPTTELADPNLAATIWSEQVHPPGPQLGTRHRVDPPWLGMPAPPEPLPELDAGEPWADRGWIERDPPSSDRDDPLWSPSGWLAEADQLTGPSPAGDDGQAGTSENGRATIPPPRVPVDIPPTAPTADVDGKPTNWLFDEPWWPPDVADDEDPPFAPGPNETDSLSPFGPVRYRATRPSSDPVSRGDQPPGDASPAPADPDEPPTGPFPPDLPAFVPTPRAPSSAGQHAAPSAPADAGGDTATPGWPADTATDTGPAATAAQAQQVDPTGRPAEPDGSPRASAGTLSRLPRREVSRMPDRRRRLPVRRERGELVPVPRPTPTISRSRAPMLVFTGAVVVLLGAAAVVAGVSLVGDTSAGPAALPSAAGTQQPPASPTPPPAAPGSPPSDVGLQDNRDSVTLSWFYPVGAEGQVLISGGSSDQEPRAFMQLPPGATSFIAYGLDQSIDYCFTVAVVYSADLIGRADPVCTDRTPAQ
ncbi:tetratricopeptide repeat protein [Micromonospora sp. LOL_023]|uniref:tetratricopeptide repeat protein n=1 Tax=Micromonospora sp. LOL_023 TaxID=3345418 RepID=UPI003A84744F